MKKEVVHIEDHDENAFALSTGDLMAGLLFIFILLLMSTMLRVRESIENIGDITVKYNNIKTQLYIDLDSAFKDSLTVWRATIDSSSLCIRFQDPSTLFDEGESVLKENFKQILDDFFPRYIAVLEQPQYKDKIEEIRIEGHTNSNGDYFYNMKLSQDRTRAVLQYCLGLEDFNDMDWIKRHVTANGLSSSQLIYMDSARTIEDKNLSRRVEFSVRTNAENQLDSIINIIQSKNE